MSNESPTDKAIKASAEGIAPAPKREAVPELTDDDKLYHDIIVAIDEAGMLPKDWVKCRMFNYNGRPDILVNFYIEEDTDLIMMKEHKIDAVRVTLFDDFMTVERP